MSNTVVIIPSRLKAKRLPNKPLKLINKKEMILHVCDLAKKSGVGKVLVATPDKDIFQLIKKNNYFTGNLTSSCFDFLCLKS